jgi:hypothetical protein
VEKISPLSKAHIAYSTQKQHRHKVSQKATELTSSPYISALQVTRQINRDSQNSHGNLRQKQQNGVKSILNFLHDCCFGEIWEGVPEESMIQCMSCKEWCHENCDGVKKGKNCFFASTSSEVVSLIYFFAYFHKKKLMK